MTWAPKDQTRRLYASEKDHTRTSPKLFVAPPSGDLRLEVEGETRAQRIARFDAYQKTHQRAREAGRLRCERWVRFVTASEFWRTNGLPPKVLVGKQAVDAHASRGGEYAKGWKIRLTLAGMTPYVCLHELAHVADMATTKRQKGSARSCGHGPTFAAWLLALVELADGRTAAVDLARSMTEHGAIIDTALLEELRTRLPAEPLWPRVAGQVLPATPVAKIAAAIAAAPSPKITSEYRARAAQPSHHRPTTSVQASLF